MTIPLRAPIHAVCFDWGGTLMTEDGPQELPMAQWPTVAAMPGAVACLAELQGHVPLCLVTNAAVSRSPMIERALERVGLQSYITDIFCFTELHFRKSQPEFWRAVEQRMGLPLNQIAMVGDSMEQDVLAPRNFGLQSVWFNSAGGRHEAQTMVPTVTELEQFARLVRNAL